MKLGEIPRGESGRTEEFQGLRKKKKISPRGGKITSYEKENKSGCPVLEAKTVFQERFDHAYKIMLIG